MQNLRSAKDKGTQQTSAAAAAKLEQFAHAPALTPPKKGSQTKSQQGGALDRRSQGQTQALTQLSTATLPAVPPKIRSNKGQGLNDQNVVVDVITDPTMPILPPVKEPTITDVFLAVNVCSNSLKELCEQMKGVKEDGRVFRLGEGYWVGGGEEGDTIRIAETAIIRKVGLKALTSRNIRTLKRIICFGSRNIHNLRIIGKYLKPTLVMLDTLFKIIFYFGMEGPGNARFKILYRRGVFICPHYLKAPRFLVGEVIWNPRVKILHSRGMLRYYIFNEFGFFFFVMDIPFRLVLVFLWYLDAS